MFDWVDDAWDAVTDAAHHVADAAASFAEELASMVAAQAEALMDAIAHFDIKDFGHDLLQVFKELALLVASPVMAAGVAAYWAYLREMSPRGQKGLPRNLVLLLQPYFGTDLNDVRYADDVNTLNGMAVTLDTEIFFNKKLELSKPSGVKWLLHELRHVDQYRKEGGVAKFVAKYAGDVAKSIATNRTVNVHDILSLEKDADQFASSHLDFVMCKEGFASQGGGIPEKYIFDPDFYLNRHQDVANAAAKEYNGGQPSFLAGVKAAAARTLASTRTVRARRFGEQLFARYLTRIAIPEALFCRNFALRHWIEFGIREGRESSPTFDVTGYVARYPDLQQAFGTDWRRAIDHYIEYGQKEGRDTSAVHNGQPAQPLPVNRLAPIMGTIPA